MLTSKKKCDHCGQDINRDAFICQHCGRAQAPKPVAPRQAPGRQLSLRTRLVLIAAAAYVLLTMLANWWRFDLVNHEKEHLSACVITLEDQWRAMIQTALAFR